MCCFYPSPPPLPQPWRQDHHSHAHGAYSGWCSPYLLLLVADTLHILADGVALGASVSHGLTLGLTTSFALLFHELPHMFGECGEVCGGGYVWW